MKGTLPALLVAGACMLVPGRPGTAAATFRTVSQGPHSGVAKPEKVVVRSQAEMQKVWTLVHNQSSATKPLPRVNWDHEMVLGVFLGMRPSSGYKVDIREVKEMGGKLVVRVAETRPPKDAITLTVLTHPYHLVAVKKSALPVVWE